MKDGKTQCNKVEKLIALRHDYDTSIGICGDFIIKLITHKSKRLYPENIWMVTCRD